MGSRARTVGFPEFPPSRFGPLDRTPASLLRFPALEARHSLSARRARAFRLSIRRKCVDTTTGFDLTSIITIVVVLGILSVLFGGGLGGFKIPFFN
jgi:hypothetical protein